MTGHSCEAGHDRHDRVTVETDSGRMVVYDWRRYQGIVGYCPGNCAVSETIDNTGRWEPHGTTLMQAVLKQRPAGVVWDFGSHVGWYSRVAVLMGYEVVAVDGDAENLELVALNAPAAQRRHAWVDETLEPVAGPVAFAKIDVEGNDRFAVAALAGPLGRREVAALMVEISPVFNDTYPAMVREILDCGYEAFVVPHGGHPDQYEFFSRPLGYLRERMRIDSPDEAVAAAPQSDFLFLPEAR